MPFRTPSDPPPPSAEEQEESRNTLANSLLLMRENITPALDAGDGLRADLLARGWSPQAADLIGAAWLTNVLRMLTNPGGGAQ